MTPEQRRRKSERATIYRAERKKKGICSDCGGKIEEGRTCNRCNTCKEKNSKKKLDSIIDYRNKTFVILGDKCIDCGTTDRRVFTIDHPDGDGKHHRRKNVVNWKHYYLAAQTGDIFLEIRCYNCHAIKDLKRNL